jgi:hypothetical protein
MRSTITKLFISLLFVSATVSFNVANASEPTVEEFNAAFVEANEARKMSGSLGHEWRDPVKFLRAAQKAAVDGDLVKAMKLVAQAKFQSDAAIVQANREQSLWIGRVIR